MFSDTSINFMSEFLNSAATSEEIRPVPAPRSRTFIFLSRLKEIISTAIL